MLTIFVPGPRVYVPKPAFLPCDHEVVHSGDVLCCTCTMHHSLHGRSRFSDKMDILWFVQNSGSQILLTTAENIHGHFTQPLRHHRKPTISEILTAALELATTSDINWSHTVMISNYLLKPTVCRDEYMCGVVVCVHDSYYGTGFNWLSLVDSVTVYPALCAAASATRQGNCEEHAGERSPRLLLEKRTPAGCVCESLREHHCVTLHHLIAAVVTAIMTHSLFGYNSSQHPSVFDPISIFILRLSDSTPRRKHY